MSKRYKQTAITAITALTTLSLIVAASPTLANDTSSVFYISNNDTDGRATYGVQLNSNCSPSGNNPVYFYWQRADGSKRELSKLEKTAYGISNSSVSGKKVTFSVNAFQKRGIDKPVTITTSRSSSGSCQATALTTIKGVETPLSHAHIQGKSKKIAGETVQFTVQNITITALNQNSETIACRSNCKVGIPFP
jgi:Domain of unknown function (DUF4833)